jgi:hypothetical protein
VATKRVDERLPQRRTATNPLRQQRAIQIDAFTRINRRLSVKRQVICELRDQYVS